MTDSKQAAVTPRIEWSSWSALYWVGAAVLFGALFEDAFWGLWANYTSVDSYYMHGPVVPVVSAFLVWRKWPKLRGMPLAPAWSGIGTVTAACLLIILGDFLGFRIFGQISLLLMVVGLVATICGWSYVATLWFPLAFLLFMIPIPTSVTASLALNVKLFATEAAVSLAQLVFLPMVRDGSYVVFGSDRVLVGEVCGGLRSLISLLALGAIMSYISESRNWARCLLFVLSVPIALASNIVRIFFLCVVAYFWGSESATGKVHDVSGLLIFAIAFVLFLGAEYLLRRLAPSKSEGGASE